MSGKNFLNMFKLNETDINVKIKTLSQCGPGDHGNLVFSRSADVSLV